MDVVTLGGDAEGDLEAERLELTHVVAGSAFSVDAVGEVVRTEVAIAQSGFGQQVPDDHQGGSGDSDEGACPTERAGHGAPDVCTRAPRRPST